MSKITIDLDDLDDVTRQDLERYAEMEEWSLSRTARELVAIGLRVPLTGLGMSLHDWMQFDDEQAQSVDAVSPAPPTGVQWVQ